MRLVDGMMYCTAACRQLHASGANRRIRNAPTDAALKVPSGCPAHHVGLLGVLLVHGCLSESQPPLRVTRNDFRPARYGHRGPFGHAVNDLRCKGPGVLLVSVTEVATSAPSAQRAGCQVGDVVADPVDIVILLYCSADGSVGSYFDDHWGSAVVLDQLVDPPPKVGVRRVRRSQGCRHAIFDPLQHVPTVAYVVGSRRRAPQKLDEGV